MDNWSSLLEDLCAVVADNEAAADMVICKVQMGIAYLCPSEPVAVDKSQCLVVGVLLALREVHGIAAGLLEGCQRLQDKSFAMNKFIEFMSEELEDDESQDGEFN